MTQLLIFLAVLAILVLLMSRSMKHRDEGYNLDTLIPL